jgi:hypothetical protein
VYPNGCLKRPVTSLESPPGKAGFSVSELLLLGDLPPPFDELLQHLAAVAQALAFLEIIKKSDRLARQIGDELKAAFGGKPAPIGAVFVADGILSRLHGPSPVRA